MATGESRPLPRRHVGEAFRRDGRWWRQGKLGPYLIWDELDTSLVRVKRDPICPLCARGDVEHSSRYHLEAVYEARRKAICHPSRTDLVTGY